MKNKIELGKKPRQLSTPTHPMRYCSAHHINPAATALIVAGKALK